MHGHSIPHFHWPTFVVICVDQCALRWPKREVRLEPLVHCCKLCYLLDLIVLSELWSASRMSGKIGLSEKPFLVKTSDKVNLLREREREGERETPFQLTSNPSGQPWKPAMRKTFMGALSYDFFFTNYWEKYEDKLCHQMSSGRVS